MKIRRMLCSVLIGILISVQIKVVPVKASSSLLGVNLADIIVSIFNASGTAIGDASLFNDIQSAYGGITIENMVDNGVIYAQNPEMSKEDIKEMVGYGNLDAPVLRVDGSKFKSMLSSAIVNPVTLSALDAMFNFGNNVSDGISGILGNITGMVAEIGKIWYNLGVNIYDAMNGPWPVNTVRDLYDHFIASGYFQELLSQGIEGGGSVAPPAGSYTVNLESFGVSGYDGIGYAVWKPGENSKNAAVDFLPRGIIGVICVIDEYCRIVLVNVTDSAVDVSIFKNSNATGGIISKNPRYGETVQRVFTNAYSVQNTGTSFKASTINYDDIVYGGYLVKAPLTVDNYLLAVEYAKAHNPWGTSGATEPYTTYINDAVGNLGTENYQTAQPNLGVNEYMTIADGAIYAQTLQQITDNTNNGDYSINSEVINNYNSVVIENALPDVRPTTAAAEATQPIQPFVDPRPTQTPAYVESVVEAGGISQEITKKFPFCIPWDLKALVDSLWAPKAQAPKIHWDATFGSLGKMGEVDVDLSAFDTVAKIFRTTTLLLWIAGLVIITRDLIG